MDNEMKEMLNTILTSINSMQNDIASLKEDVTLIKKDVKHLKTEMIKAQAMDEAILNEVERVHGILDKHVADPKAHIA